MGRSKVYTKLLYFSVAVLGFTSGLSLKFLLPNLSPARLVVYTDQGFSPEDLHIPLNSRVTFINRSSQNFWPASDLHPTHELYPDFDARRSLPPGSQWTFKFRKPGNWRFHNHLNASQRGRILVGNQQQSASQLRDCRDLPERTDKLNCWNENLIQIIGGHGAKAALDYATAEFQASADFRSGCHDLLHKIGEETYDSHQSLAAAGTSANFCAYGFFHGYMLRLLDSGGDLTEAKALCQEVTEHNTATAGDACLHGFGHGLLLTAAESGKYSGAEDMTHAALSQCETMASGTNTEASRCSSGIFMQLAESTTAGNYGLKLDAHNPLGICNQVPNFYQGDCYRQMQVAVMTLGHSQLSYGLALAQKLPPAYATTALEHYVAGISRPTEPAALKEILQSCHGIPEAALSEACEEGTLLSFLMKGPPGKEAEAALEFCQAHFSPTRQADCARYVLNYAKRAYEPAHLVSLCQKARKINPSLPDCNPPVN